ISALLTAAQLIPLPAGLVEALNPLAALRTDGVQLAGVSTWSSLSLDPPGTALGLSYFLVLLGAATVALRIAASERARFGMLAAVAVVCGLAAATAGIHELLQLTSLYGV